jgi:hypothetical protein
MRMPLQILKNQRLGRRERRKRDRQISKGWGTKQRYRKRCRLTRRTSASHRQRRVDL